MQPFNFSAVCHICVIGSSFHDAQSAYQRQRLNHWQINPACGNTSADFDVSGSWHAWFVPASTAA